MKLTGLGIGSGFTIIDRGDAEGIIKQLLGGADAVQVASTLYENGKGQEYFLKHIFDKSTERQVMELKTYTLSELVRLTGIARNVLQRAVDNGDLVGFPCGERIRFNEQQVQEFLHLNKGEEK